MKKLRNIMSRRRMLALLLSMVMFVTAVPMTAFAAETDVFTDFAQTGQLEEPEGIDTGVDVQAVEEEIEPENDIFTDTESQEAVFSAGEEIVLENEEGVEETFAVGTPKAAYQLNNGQGQNIDVFVVNQYGESIEVTPPSNKKVSLGVDTDIKPYLPVPVLENYKKITPTVHANIMNGTEFDYIKYHINKGFFDSPTGWKYVESRKLKGLNKVYIVYNDPELVEITFNKNGGDLTPTPQTAHLKIGEMYTFPNYTGTKAVDGKELKFIGWSVDDDATGKNADNGITHSKSVIFEPNKTYEVQDSMFYKYDGSKQYTFYATWAQENIAGTYYIKLHPTIPNEPSYSPAPDYTSGYTLENAISLGAFYSNSANGVQDRLNAMPTSEQLANVINDSKDKLGFEVQAISGGSGVKVSKITDYTKNNAGYQVNLGDELYVHWYVIKCATSGPICHGIPTDWHIDGVLLRKSKITLNYDFNAPSNVLEPNSKSAGSEWNKGELVRAGYCGDKKEVVTPERIDGYVFSGWKEFVWDSLTDTYKSTGEVYSAGESFTINENTKLEAQWVKGENRLFIRKVDDFNEPLSGVDFTVTEVLTGMEQSGKTDENGKLGDTENTKIEIKSDTIYKVKENAPLGYKEIVPFYFTVKLNSKNAMDVFFVDSKGVEVAKPNVEDVNMSYNPLSKNVFMEIKNHGEFYVYHSSDQTVETIQMSEVTDTFNITEKVKSGHIYGGYYRDYKKKGSYNGGPNNPDKSSGKNYTGIDVTKLGESNGVWWNLKDAITECGMHIKPRPGMTYYLKEVPEEYLCSRIISVYDRHANTLMRNLFFVTVVDDCNYKEVGFDTGLGSVTKVYKNIEVQGFSGGVYNPGAITSYGVNRISDEIIQDNYGFLGFTEYKNQNGNLKGKLNLEYVPYYVTLDDVKVTSTTKSKIDSPDGTWNKLNRTEINVQSGVKEHTVGSNSPMAYYGMYTVGSETDPDTPTSKEVQIRKVDDGTETVQIVEPGNLSGKIAYIGKAGYTFAGWYLEPECVTPADFSDVQGNMTVYAKYIHNSKISAFIRTTGREAGVVNLKTTISFIEHDGFSEVGFTYKFKDQEGTVVTDRKSVFKGNSLLGSIKAGKSVYSYSANWSLNGLRVMNDFTVMPYWVTKDGTVVNGKAKKCMYLFGTII